MTTVRLSPETEKRLALLAKKTGRSKSFYICEMIESKIDDFEDYYLAADTLERVRDGREKARGLAAAREQLGVED